MLSVKKLSFEYKKNVPILKNVNFTLRKGVTLLVGENGSGKSTLIQVLTKAFATESDIFWNEEKLDNISLKEKMAYLPQKFEVYPSVKVKDLLEFVALARGIKKSDIKKEVAEVARKVNIDSYLQQKIRKCSIGTKQRVGIASTLLGNAEIVIMDEPTAGIDPKERVRFYQIVKDFLADKTVLISTHILDDIEILADNVLMLSNGEITFDGDYQKFLHSLDGLLFRIELSRLKESDLMQCVHVLKQEREGDKIFYHVIAKNNSGEIESFAEQIKPTLEDLWNYYQERNRWENGIEN
ncbi:MAG: ATP-binding cassette domain-containing protein [Peptostreptococcaceae bacterium]|nr:ATP-binding cassette domain-containing protein [Peptostreptococcaceae bacterium]